MAWNWNGMDGILGLVRIRDLPSKLNPFRKGHGLACYAWGGPHAYGGMIMGPDGGGNRQTCQKTCLAGP